MFVQVKGDDGLTIGGYIEIYYSYDFDKPENHLRPRHIFSYNRSNEVNVNLSMIKLSYTKEREKVNLSLMAGTYTNAYLSSEAGRELKKKNSTVTSSLLTAL